MPNLQLRFIRLLLAVIFAAALLRLAGFAIRFASEGLQMDFAAFYTAGEAVSLGLSPYTNHLNEPSQVWDGVNISAHSRFHYPPLAANFFQLFALLPYHTAKMVWTGLAALCLCASVYLALQVIRPPSTPVHRLILGILVCWFYPVLILFERGQVDALTLLLLTVGIVWIVTRRHLFWAGLLFALAAVLKLHCLYLLPFLALRRQWQAATGLAAGVAGLALLSTLLNGPASSLDYIRKEIPFVANYGEVTASGTEPFLQKFNELVQDLPESYTLKDGRKYRGALMLFDVNASLVGTRLSTWVGAVTRRLFTGEPNVASLSLVYFGTAFGLFAGGEWRHRFRSQEADAQAEYIYWQIPVALILLCAPLTWAMNCVWLLPAAVVFLREVSRLGNITARSQENWRLACLGAGVVGLLLVAMPDSWGFQMLTPYAAGLTRLKYVLGELLVLGGLWGMLEFHRRQA